MKHRASPRFWSSYEALPVAVQELADRTYEQLKTDPHHPSLHHKRIGRFFSSGRRSLHSPLISPLHPRGIAIEVLHIHDLGFRRGPGGGRSVCRSGVTAAGGAPAPLGA